MTASVSATGTETIVERFSSGNARNAEPCAASASCSRRESTALRSSSARIPNCRKIPSAARSASAANHASEASSFDAVGDSSIAGP